MTPQGRRFDQSMAEELARESHVIMICGRYEGVDERIREHLVTDEVSIGDYVLTGRRTAGAGGGGCGGEAAAGSARDDESRPRANRFRAGCWSIRSIRVPRSFEDTRCPRYCFRAIMKRYGNGGARRRWNGRSRGVPTCWRARR